MSISHVQTALLVQLSSVSSGEWVMGAMTSSNLIRVRMASYNGTTLSGSITDTQGNLYVKVVDADSISPSGKWASEWWTFAQSGSNTITVDRDGVGAGTHQIVGAVSEYYSSTGWPTNPVHTFDSASANEQSPTSPTASVTINTPVLIGASITDWDSNDDYTAPSGTWVNRQAEQGNGDHNAFFTEDRIVSASGTYNAQWTTAGTIPRSKIIVAYEASPTLISHIQTVTGSVLNSLTPPSLVMASMTASNLIRVIASAYLYTLSGTVGDTQGNTYTPVVGGVVNARQMYEWWAIAQDGANTITVDPGSQTWTTTLASEYYSTTGWPANPVHSADSSSYTGADPVSPDVVVTASQALAFISMTGDSTTLVTSPGLPWINRIEVDGVDPTDSYRAVISEEQLVSSGTYNGQWIHASANHFLFATSYIPAESLPSPHQYDPVIFRPSILDSPFIIRPTIDNMAGILKS